MKKNGGLIAFALAIAFGVLAVFLANKWLAAQNTQATVIPKETVPMTMVVVAAKDLTIGSPLTKDTLTLAEWPKASAPQGAFSDISMVEGRVAVTKLMARQPVLAAELAPPGSGAGLVAVIKPGMRAMSVRVDEVTGVGGFVLPHTTVDIIGIETLQNDRRVAKTILKGIKVLAIAQETFTEEGKAKVVRTVTLELKPEKAEILALQTHKGDIHLVLRNPLEEVEPEVEPEVKKVVTAKVVKKAPPRRRVVYTPPPQPDPYAVEVIRGSQQPEIIKFKNINSDERL